jgi:ABC-2 type transport system permease protein
MNPILLIMQKEWLELRKERTLLATTLLPPLLLTLLPLVVLFGVAQQPGDVRDLPAINDPSLAGLGTAELAQAVVGRSLGVLLLLLPVLIPSVIASYSIIGEKTRRTLEPLLATPLETWQLLLAKSLAALIPAVAITWLCGALFAAGVAAVAVSGRVLGAVVSPGWLLALLLCAPPLALITVAATVAISSRVNDPRTAQQISAVVVVPLMGLVFGQLSGVITLSPPLIAGVALVLALVAALAVWLAVRLFGREAILTRWT